MKQYRLVITVGVALSADCALFALTPHGWIQYVPPLFLLLIVAVLVRQIGRSGVRSIVASSVTVVAEGLLLPVAGILIASAVFRYPAMLAGAWAGAMAAGVLSLTAILAFWAQRTRDPRWINWFFNQPW